jgi:hypothetical protein
MNIMRLGNLVLKATCWDMDENPISFGETPHQIDSIDNIRIGLHDYPEFRGSIDVPVKDIAGIELTKEWLLKFGFKFNDSASEWILGNFSITFTNEYIYQNRYSTAKLMYVHQLQNLHFALTEKELELKT